MIYDSSIPSPPPSSSSSDQQPLIRKRTLHSRSSALYDGSDDDDDDNIRSRSRRLMRRVRKLDIYHKTRETAQQKSYVGAGVSFVVFAIIGFLFLSEFLIYLKPRRLDTLSVDLDRQEPIQIFLNITFPLVRCDELHLDVMDQSGEMQIAVMHNIFKQPTDEHGNIVGMKHRDRKMGKELVHQPYDATNDPRSPRYCGSCYNARTISVRCCNTCAIVLSQYKKLGLTPPPLEDIEQCVNENAANHPGCNIDGMLTVNKVAGNFHFAPGRSFAQAQELHVHHVHEFNPTLVARFNTSHIVNSLSFGVPIPRLRSDPLSGTRTIVLPPAPPPSSQAIARTTNIGGTGNREPLHDPLRHLHLHKYFIKAVPTTYRATNFLASDTKTYQYSFTKHTQVFNGHKNMVLPGVFFVYDLSPMRITYTDTSEPFIRFIVRLCAVLGGIFTVSGYSSRLVGAMLKQWSKKFE